MPYALRSPTIHALLDHASRLDTVRMRDKFYDLYECEQDGLFLLCEHGTDQITAVLSPLFWADLSGETTD
ncbi:hypothetical protein [Sulfobacillus thermosulfidooxidans]|uniref:hypothetical protein n=1 Tax=Sulfobacillus thermosulfidooxidans TaxID=28034 RepID=UPI0006B4317D|nr:hypothetical protein [Sulfobacillus thermosulfidooxidans]